MPADYVSKVVKLAAVAMPCELPKMRDWEAVEAEIGFVFPSDFKALISRLGGGEFGSGFYLRNPCSSSEYVRLSRECLIRHREPICDLEGKLAFPLYPSAGGNVAIASIDRQDFYLQPDFSGKRLDELVWLDIDLEEVRPLNYAIPQFIHDLYLGLITEPWAEALRESIWRGGREPFFTSRPGSNPSE